MTWQQQQPGALNCCENSWMSLKILFGPWQWAQQRRLDLELENKMKKHSINKILWLCSLRMSTLVSRNRVSPTLNVILCDIQSKEWKLFWQLAFHISYIFRSRCWVWTSGNSKFSKFYAKFETNFNYRNDDTSKLTHKIFSSAAWNRDIERVKITQHSHNENNLKMSIKLKSKFFLEMCLLYREWKWANSESNLNSTWSSHSRDKDNYFNYIVHRIGIVSVLR